MTRINKDCYSFFSGIRSNKQDLAIILISGDCIYCVNLLNGDVKWSLSGKPEWPIGLSNGVFVSLADGGFTFRSTCNGKLTESVSFSNIPKSFLKDIDVDGAEWMFEHSGGQSVLSRKWDRVLNRGMVQVDDKAVKAYEISCIQINHNTGENTLQSNVFKSLDVQQKKPMVVSGQIQQSVINSQNIQQNEINREYIADDYYTIEVDDNSRLKMCKYIQSKSEAEWVAPLKYSNLLNSKPYMAL